MDPHGQSLIPLFITEQLERAANLALNYAPVTRMQLGKLRGKRFALEMQRPSIQLLVEVSRQRLHLQNHWDQAADVTVRGPALALLRQLNSDNNSPADLMAKGIEVDGDQQLAQQFITLLKDLDLDLETALGDVIGDLAAHQLSGLARSGFNLLRGTARAVLQQSQHWLVEERDMVLKRDEFTRFEQDVDALRQHSDRLQARLDNIKHTHENQDETNP